MKKIDVTNPFVLQPYVSKDLFCDRVSEMNNLISHVANGSNVTLISIRRIGKTGLIMRAFDELRSKKWGYVTIYADIYATNCLEDFIRTLAEAVVSQCSESGIKRFISSLGGLRPLLSYDPISGQPQLSIAYQTESQKMTTLQSIFSYLEGLGKKVVVAIDEFQQIREYENVKMEALLRSYIQNTKNVRFIFSGSRKHTMTDMFDSQRAPFYQSSVNIPLGKIDPAIYGDFIREKFRNGGKSISEDAVGFILEWSRCHTFYTQRLCNEVYASSSEDAGMEDVYAAIENIFLSEKDKFFTIRGMLTKGQWRYLTAVAKEGTLKQPTSGAFLNKYNLGTPASSKRTLSSLIDKELIMDTDTENGHQYSVYNIFLSRWLESAN